MDILLHNREILLTTLFSTKYINNNSLQINFVNNSAIILWQYWHGEYISMFVSIYYGYLFLTGSTYWRYMKRIRKKPKYASRSLSSWRRPSSSDTSAMISWAASCMDWLLFRFRSKLMEVEMLNSNSFLIRSKAAIVARGKNNKN